MICVAGYPGTQQQDLIDVKLALTRLKYKCSDG